MAGSYVLHHALSFQTAPFSSHNLADASKHLFLAILLQSKLVSLAPICTHLLRLIPHRVCFSGQVNGLSLTDTWKPFVPHCHSCHRCPHGPVPGQANVLTQLRGTRVFCLAQIPRAIPPCRDNPAEVRGAAHAGVGFVTGGGGGETLPTLAKHLQKAYIHGFLES